MSKKSKRSTLKCAKVVVNENAYMIIEDLVGTENYKDFKEFIHKMNTIVGCECDTRGNNDGLLEFMLRNNGNKLCFEILTDTKYKPLVTKGWIETMDEVVLNNGADYKALFIKIMYVHNAKSDDKAFNAFLEAMDCYVPKADNINFMNKANYMSN